MILISEKFSISRGGHAVFCDNENSIIRSARKLSVDDSYGVCFEKEKSIDSKSWDEIREFAVVNSVSSRDGDKMSRRISNDKNSEIVICDQSRIKKNICILTGLARITFFAFAGNKKKTEKNRKNNSFHFFNLLLFSGSLPYASMKTQQKLTWLKIIWN